MDLIPKQSKIKMVKEKVNDQFYRENENSIHKRKQNIKRTVSHSIQFNCRLIKCAMLMAYPIIYN